MGRVRGNNDEYLCGIMKCRAFIGDKKSQSFFITPTPRPVPPCSAKEYISQAWAGAELCGGISL